MPNIEALKQLRRVVENAPDELLHMNAVVEQAGCGTARCALGWALIDPWFKENTVLGVYAEWEGRMTPLSEYELADVFGIRPRDADKLFALDCGPCIDPHAISKAEVIYSIDMLIDGFPAPAYAALVDDDDDDDEAEESNF